MNAKKTEWSENPFIGDTVTADNGSSVTFMKKFVKENTDLLLGLFMALSIIEGAALLWQWGHKEQQSDLAIYQLQDFQNHVFNKVAAQVDANTALINAYGLQKTIETTCKR